MLRFTERGAVEAPATLQVRVTSSFTGRIVAGAPTPSTSLDANALRENLRYFAVDRGPRERRCSSLVLSGAGIHTQPPLVDVIGNAREWGYERVTAHVAPGEAAGLLATPLAGLLTATAVAVTSPQAVTDVAILRDHPGHVTAAVLLDASGVDNVAATAVALCRAGPDRVVFTWPLTGTPPPRAERAGQAARVGLAICDAHGIAAGVKGLPICRIGDERRLWRSANRWYVDNDHQLARALLFFPDVVRFAKGDVCRFCRVDGACDGAPAQWVDADLVGPLEPLT